MASGEQCKDKELPLFLQFNTSDHLEKPIDVPVTGTLPKWLKGSLYRNGSGMYKVGETSWKHLFDGFAVLQRWTIQDGKVTYLSSILDSDHYQKCVKSNRLIGTGFGSFFPDPCKSIFSRLFSYFLPHPPGRTDNTAVNIVPHGDRLFAMTETTLINEIKPENLQKKGEINVAPILALHMGTAHPHAEKDGTMYYYGTCMNYTKAYNFVRVPPPNSNSPDSPFSKAEVIGTVASRWKMNMGYTHSFGMTENYFVHFELPMTFNLPKLMTFNTRSSGVQGTMNNYPDEPISIHVVNKKTGKRLPINFIAPHGFVFHFINCFEESGQVVCDVCFYNSTAIVQMLYLNALNSVEGDKRSNVHFTRFVLPLSIEGAEPGKNLVTLSDTKATAVLKKGTKETLEVTPDYMFGDTHRMELPRINYDYNGQKYRYAYGTTVFDKKERNLMKFDTKEKKVEVWSCDEHHIPGEPVFIPAPGATKEDDGVVLCPILADTTDHSSFLLVLDAASFKEIARATNPPDLKMSLTFHGFFSDMVF